MLVSISSSYSRIYPSTHTLIAGIVLGLAQVLLRVCKALLSKQYLSEWDAPILTV